MKNIVLGLLLIITTVSIATSILEVNTSGFPIVKVVVAGAESVNILENSQTVDIFKIEKNDGLLAKSLIKNNPRETNPYIAKTTHAIIGSSLSYIQMETVRTGTITKSSQYSFSLAFGANTTSYNVNISIKFAFTSSYKTVTTTEILILRTLTFSNEVQKNQQVRKM